VNSDLIKLGVWVVIIGGTFGYLWRKGHLLKISNYVAETREELRKCSWPSLEELKGSTVVVMISILLLGLLTMGADFVVLKFVRGILPKI
jgi:preprotein translocase subunit SecE